MSVTSAYLTTAKNLPKILVAIQNAQAPKQFSTRFLASLGFPSANDRLIIGVLKALGFLTPEGTPTKRYFEYLDQSRAKYVLADGIREAYADLFQINTKANELTNVDVKNKLKTLTQGQSSAPVLDKNGYDIQVSFATRGFYGDLGSRTREIANSSDHDWTRSNAKREHTRGSKGDIRGTGL